MTERRPYIEFKGIKPVACDPDLKAVSPPQKPVPESNLYWTPQAVECYLSGKGQRRCEDCPRQAVEPCRMPETVRGTLKKWGEPIKRVNLRGCVSWHGRHSKVPDQNERINLIEAMAEGETINAHEAARLLDIRVESARQYLVAAVKMGLLAKEKRRHKFEGRWFNTLYRRVAARK